jgi:sirohydrochlorin ferrochelatase
MSRPGTAVVLVAHGSRDPRAAAATRALARSVAAARPGWDVRDSYLDHSLPRPVDVLADLAGAGHRRAVMVPLLLTAAYHGRVDVPAEVAAARAAGLRLDVDITDVLGPKGGHVDPLLTAGLIRRLAEADQIPADHPADGHPADGHPADGHPADGYAADGYAADGHPADGYAADGHSADGPSAGGLVLPNRSGTDGSGCPAVLPLDGRRIGGSGFDAVVLAAAGTRDSGARGTVGRAAAALGARLGVPCRVAYASAAPPAAGAAVQRLRAAGACRVAVAAYFLAPGLLYDATVASARAAGAAGVAAPLGGAPELVDLVLSRIDATAVPPWIAYAA